MRKILSILAAAVAMDVAAQSVNTRTYNFVDVTAQATWTKPQAVTWYQAETVQLNERFATNLTLDVDATNLLMVWEVVARTNPATAYIVSTGTVVSAASNYVRWTVGPTNSNLAAGQYRGFVRALEVSGTNLVNVGVLAVQDIAVNASPDSRYYAFQGPLSYSLAGALTGLVVDGVAASITGQTAYANTAGGGGAITSIVRGAGSSTRLSVSNGVGPIVTLNLDVSGLATGTPVYSLSGYATGTPVYAETDPRWQAGTGALWSAINSKGTGTVGSLSGVAMQGGTYTGDVRAATSAGGALANMSGSNVLTWGMGGGTAVALSGALTINGGSTVATGTPVYAESDPVWVGASNLYYTKVLADAKFATGTPVYVITSNTLSGVDGSGLTNLPSSGGGSGSPTQEEFTVTGDSGNGDWKLMSYSTSGWGFTNDQTVALAYNLTHNGSTWNERPLTNRVGAVIAFEPYYEYTNGTGVVRQSEFYIGHVHTNQSPQDVLGSTALSRVFQFDWIWPGSSGYPNGGRSGNLSMDALSMSNATFSGLINVGANAFSQPVRLVQQRQASAPGTNGTIASVRDATPWGGGVETNIQVELIRLTNSPQSALSLVMYGDNGQTTERYRFTPSALEASVGAIRQTVDGTLTDLFTNGWLVASILAPDNQYLNTNDIPRQFGWIGGQRNRFLPSLFQPGGTNVFGLVGGGGYSNAWLMSAAQGTMLAGGMSNSSLSDVSGAASVGGFNNFLNGAIGGLIGGGRGNTMSGNYSALLGGQGDTLSGGWSVMGGRENVAAPNYSFVVGYQNQVQASAQMSTIAGGNTNVIAGALYAFIGAGARNIIGSGGTYGTIPGGTSNQVLAAGGFAAGNAAVVSATATGSFFYSAGQLPVTNSTPRSAAFNVPGGFMLSGGGSYGADSQQGISVTNLLLRSDGVSVYTQIVVRGIIIQ